MQANKIRGEDLNLSREMSLGFALSIIVQENDYYKNKKVYDLVEVLLRSHLFPDSELREMKIRLASSLPPESQRSEEALYWLSYSKPGIKWPEIYAFKVLLSDRHYEENKELHGLVKSLLPMVLDYKIENKRPFGNPEKILEHLNETDKIKFIFNLNILS